MGYIILSVRALVLTCTFKTYLNKNSKKLVLNTRKFRRKEFIIT